MTDQWFDAIAEALEARRADVLSDFATYRLIHAYCTQIAVDLDIVHVGTIVLDDEAES